MDIEAIIREIEALSPEKQEEVSDFISSLSVSAKKVQGRRASRGRNISDEGFIGIWKDREEFEDSTSWVRNLRKIEW